MSTTFWYELYLFQGFSKVVRRYFETIIGAEIYPTYFSPPYNSFNTLKEISCELKETDSHFRQTHAVMIK